MSSFLFLNFCITYWILVLILVTEAKTSCDSVNSAKKGYLKVLKGKVTDSRCLNDVLLEKRNGERYCLAKKSNPTDNEKLDCIESEARVFTQTSDDGGGKMVIKYFWFQY